MNLTLELSLNPANTGSAVISDAQGLGTVTNDDTAGVSVSAISGNTTEAGGTATFTVVLDSQPSDTVTIALSSDDPSEGTAGGPRP